MSRSNATSLSKKEGENPYLVFARLFDFADVESLHDQLWEWLKITVSGAFNTKLVDKRQRYDLIIHYEHIKRTIEVAHIMHMQAKNHKREPRKINTHKNSSKLHE
jgi:hypothetical protein